MSASISRVTHQVKVLGSKTSVRAGVVLVGSLLFGLVVLPRLSGHPTRGTVVADNVSLPLLNGDGSATSSRLSLRALRGKVTVLDFWATYCAACVEQSKVLARYTSVPRPDVEVVGVNVGESPSVVATALARSPVNYTIALDDSGAVGEAFAVRSLPTLVVIDPSGRIAATVSGLVPYAQLDQMVRSAF